jgi:phosphatidylinositol phospholipase C, delta
VSLNWQSYDCGMQLNEAMFVGSPGWVLKPARLRGSGVETTAKFRFVGEVVGVSSRELSVHLAYASVTKFLSP